ncbi:MAG: undecaprenyldiphospho-muramoylpentapeptide beta-N-acetylglucosaminyltransferase [Bdellovibrionota bacterium]
MSADQKTILFAAGGTGGHVIPAFVLASEIREKHPEYRCVFVGVKGKFEEQWIPARGFDVELLDMQGVKSGSLIKRLAALLKLPNAFIQSKKVLDQYKPERVFGIGGYSSGPIMLLASLRGIPCAIIEPNAAPGLSNKILAKFVKRVYVVFAWANRYFPSKKVRNYGHLIRKSIFAVQPPSEKTAMKTVTILGGSQGSMQVNDVFCTMLEQNINELKDKITVIHQTGSRDYAHIAERYQSINVTSTVQPFFDDVEAIYGRTHLIIARSGSSVLEFAAVGIASILIPLSIAADNHQVENAKVLVATQGAIMIEEKDLTPALLFEKIQSMLNIDPSQYREQLQTLRKENAVQEIMEDFLQL